jgi:hypothetical protein
VRENIVERAKEKTMEEIIKEYFKKDLCKWGVGSLKAIFE